MSIRLNKVAKDFNVGVSTLAEFLQKKDHAVQNNPNAKISDEEYGMLEKEFSGGKKAAKSSPNVNENIKKNSQKDTKDNTQKIVKPENKVEKREPKKEEIFETKNEKKAVKLTQVGKINLDKKPEKAIIKKDKTSHEPKAQEQMQKKEPKEPKKVEVLRSAENDKPVVKKEHNVTPKTEEKPVVKPKVEAKVEPKAEPESVSKKKEPEIFTFGSRKIESKLVVKGKIDLSAINQSTRPKKKSAIEKRKEREVKLKKERDAKNKNRVNTTGTTDPAKRKRRSRIKDGKVKVADISNNNKGVVSKGPNTNRAGGSSNTNNTNRRPGTGGVNRSSGSNYGGNSRYKKNNRFAKPEVKDVDVSKQIKETLARLTSKPKKGTKYRKEKRDAVNKKIKADANREQNEKQTIKITEFVTANELAAMMNVPVVSVIQVCMNLGQMVSINQRLDAEIINFVADEFGFETEYVSADVLSQIAEEEVADTEENLEPRAPVVTVMGHVDHGKTSLLDYIRKENVIAGESGGITQHIGAYNVKLASGKKITFLDTPGHEAFTAMRARGAQVTDVAIIIIAADDDVMPQTIEAINHAKAANVPIVFAINKIDKPGANSDRIKESLSKMNYLVEDWGGKYQSQDISVKKGLNVKELLDKVLLEAEMLDLKANPNRNATGSIIESTLDKGRGYTATILVQNGTLKVGDYMIAGTSHGRIKAMFNERGNKIESVAPAEPAVILGLNGAPQAGDNFNILDSEQEAKDIANQREQLQREQGIRTSKTLTLAEIGRRIALGDFKELNLIVKGDVDGSIEALSDSLIKLSTEIIQVNVIHKAVGAISESDVTLAAASDATIVGFQVRPSGAARKLADRDGVEIKIYSVIYDAIEEIKSAMEGMLSPKIKEEITSTIDVKEVYKITKVGTVAGCVVREGKVYRGDKLRLIRDGIVKYEGEMGALKRFKDDVKDVTAGLECGLSFKTYQNIEAGDVVESYKEIEVKQKL